MLKCHLLRCIKCSHQVVHITGYGTTRQNASGGGFFWKLKASMPKIEFDLKDHQSDLVGAVLGGSHAMGILPTGFGKSLTYVLPPLLLDILEPEKKHVALVVSPLRSLMQSQVAEFSSWGVAACALLRASEMEVEVKEGIVSGNYSVLFASPEVLMTDYWQGVLKKKDFKMHVCLVAIDEAHCVIQWGTSFREDYMEITCLRAILHKSPFLFLTATCTGKMKAEILKHFDVEDVHVSAAVPNRPNIFLHYVSYPAMNMAKELDPYLQELKEKGLDARKCIIYTTVDAAGRVYEEMANIMKEDSYDKDGNRLFDLFVAKSQEEDKARILEIFPQGDSHIRCLVASCAFGMGIDIPDVELVLHWGASSSVLSYWQEVGRAGRDGRTVKAQMFATPVSVMNNKLTEDCVRALQRKDIIDKSCVRNAVLMSLFLECMPKAEMERVTHKGKCEPVCNNKNCACDVCLCCSVCQATCKCRE